MHSIRVFVFAVVRKISWAERKFIQEQEKGDGKIIKTKTENCILINKQLKAKKILLF